MYRDMSLTLGQNRKLNEVEADAAAAARRHWKRVKQAGGRHMIGFDGWQIGQERMYSSTVANRPGHQTERRAKASVMSRPKWPPSGVA